MLPLSHYHKIFYNEWKIDPSSSKYNIVFDQTFTNCLDGERLRSALQRLVSENLLLGCHVKIINEEVFFVRHYKPVDLHVYDEISDEHIYSFVSQPFALESEELYRFALYRNNSTCRVILVFHHLILDGLGFKVLVSEISKYYNETIYTHSQSLDEQRQIFLANHRLLCDHYLHSSVASLPFWQDQFAKIEAIGLGFLKSRFDDNLASQDDSYSPNPIREVRFSLSIRELHFVHSISRKYFLTPYMFSQNIFAALLRYYTDQESFLISYPLATNHHQSLLYGARVNTSFISYQFTPEMRMVDLIHDVKNFYRSLKNSGYNHALFPVNKLVSSDNKSLLNVAFASTVMKDDHFSFDGAKLISINHQFNIDYVGGLAMEVEFSSEHAEFRCKYNKSQFNHQVLTNFMQHYHQLIIAISQDLTNGVVDKPLRDYQVLTSPQYDQVINQFNQTKLSYPKNKTLHQLFYEQVEHCPENIALVYTDRKFTYRELNNKANQLANYILANYSICNEDKIALLLERNHDIVIAILAVLKIGAAYVPLDPSIAKKRLEQILYDSQPSLFLCHQQIYENNIELLEPKPKIILNHDDMTNKLDGYSLLNPQVVVANSSLAYIIYTSGTTGTPKGVMIEHRHVVNTIFHFEQLLNGANQLNLTSIANYIFDAFVLEMWVSLFFGNQMHLINENIRKDVFEFSSYINKHSISFIPYIPVKLLNVLPLIEYNSLRGLIFGGEAFNPSIIEEWRKKYKLFNVYGTTETTIFATLYEVVNGNLSKQLIGVPLSNFQIYILNKYKKPLPLGVIGELYIAGDGVGRGYLNNPTLTADKFVDNPFYKPELDNKIMYATGDLARFDATGNLEFIGRRDKQVKLRGYRIELNEITSIILRFSGVKQAVTVLKHYSNNENSVNIVSYFVADTAIDEDKLRSYLIDYLPEYMIPSYLMQLDNLPLKNASGKIDEELLPLPKLTNDIANQQFARNDLEQSICDAYATTLGLSDISIGIDDDFFTLGGNSILTISLVIKLQKYLIISVANVFEFRTPRQIAQNLQVVKGYFNNRLDMIKDIYNNLSQYNFDQLSASDQEYKQYLDKYTNIDFDFATKPIHNILLTGAAGYLGCHIFYELLHSTTYHVYVPIRAADKTEAFNKLNRAYQQYFGENLEDYLDRVSILCADLALDNLGLTPDDYSHLKDNIDSIIHSAALIKHYGYYNEFYQNNVQSTINLLDLCKHTKLKDFNYVSTYSVLTYVSGLEKDYHIFHEDSSLQSYEMKNYYNKTKYLGEQEVIRYRDFGITSNIYRIGNLAINSNSYKLPQMNDNRFIVTLQTILKLGMIYEEFTQVEISPVNITALSICKILTNPALSNQVYHVFNSNNYDLRTALVNCGVKIVSINDFIDMLKNKLLTANETDLQMLEKFILHQGWLDENIQNKKIYVTNQKTNQVLSKINVTWDTDHDLLINQFLSEIIST